MLGYKIIDVLYYIISCDQHVSRTKGTLKMWANTVAGNAEILLMAPSDTFDDNGVFQRDQNPYKQVSSNVAAGVLIGVANRSVGQGIGGFFIASFIFNTSVGRGLFKAIYFFLDFWFIQPMQVLWDLLMLPLVLVSSFIYDWHDTELLGKRNQMVKEMIADRSIWSLIKDPVVVLWR